MYKITFLLLTFMTAMLCQAQTESNAVGLDLSLLPAYEQANVVYYQSNGTTRITDVLEWVVNEKKVNYIRVRLFVDPSNDWAASIAGNKPNQLAGDLATVTALGQRIKATGAKFLLDIHYSDGWADPARQVMPKRWAETCSTQEALQDSVYSYTRDVLLHLTNAGAAPDMVQVGNEITYGIFYTVFGQPTKDYSTVVKYSTTMAGQAGLHCQAHSSGNYNTPQCWQNFTDILKSGAQAVREVCPNAKIMLHIERSGQAGVAQAWFTKMKEYEVDYDVMGLSYYPEYHGTISTLMSTVAKLEQVNDDKKIVLAEYGYSNGWAIGGSGGYTPGRIGFYKKGDVSKSCPLAQAELIGALIRELQSHPRVTGMFYWFAEENESDYSKHAPYADGWRNTGLWANEASNTASNHSDASYSAKKGAALPGLDSIGNFSNAPTAIDAIPYTSAQLGTYDMQGRLVDTRTSGQNLPAGVYIVLDEDGVSKQLR